MNTETHQLILDHLRSIRQELALIKADVRELKDGHIGIRDDIHALRGIVLDPMQGRRAVHMTHDAATPGRLKIPATGSR